MYNRIYYHLFKYLLLLSLIIFVIPDPLYSSNTPSVESDTTIIIQRIIIDGNNRTKDKTVLLFLNIDTGTVFDSSLIDVAVNNLKASGLFIHVKIFPIVNNDRVTLLVALREKSYFSISNIGGVIYNSKYGNPTDRIWLQAYGTLTINNFRGRNERLDISASIWTVRYFGLSWYKPFIKIPYYIKIGSRIGNYPSIITPWHINFFNTSFLAFGRKIGHFSKLYSSLLSNSKKYQWMGGDGELYKNDKLVKKLPKDPWLPPMKKDTAWTYIKMKIDTTDSLEFDTTYTNYSWNGFSDWKIRKYEEPFTEAFISIGWITDKRDKKFNPHKGFYFSISSITNALWPYKDIYGEKQRYLQLNNDFRFFHRGIWESNTVAYRLRPSIRLFGKGNIFSGMYMGNENTLRGYGHGAFGSYKYNHRILFSWEYRFPIVELPEMNFPWLAWYDKGLKSFHSRIDGVLILDCGYIWKDLMNFQHPSEDHKSAAGTGFGFRFMYPSLRRSICAEIVWPIYPQEFATGWPPTIYLYLDLPF